MRDLLIYHPGTGTVIPLSDEVYLVDAEIAGEAVVEELLDGSSLHVEPKDHKGYRLDNTNMTNLFFGDTR
jgi:hypothetical protein